MKGIEFSDIQAIIGVVDTLLNDAMHLYPNSSPILLPCAKSISKFLSHTIGV
jgi:hypothetical protein